MACVQDTVQGGWRTNREQDLPTTLRLGTLSSRLFIRLILIIAQAEHDPQYAWVTRHTWQSWRERYKKHAHRLDRVIESIVEHKKPMLGEKGQYGYVRVDEPKEPKPTPKPKSKRKRARKDSTPEPSQNEGAYGGPVMLSPPNARMASRPPSGPPRSQPAPAPPLPPPSQPEPARPAATQPAPRAATQPAPRAATQAPKRKATNIVDELDSESQWQIRIGDEPPPTWARPRDEDDDELAKQQSPTKRQRIRWVADTSGVSQDTDNAFQGTLACPTRASKPIQRREATIW